LPPNDPALGITGTLTALQAQPPVTAAPNMQPVRGAQAEAADLSRAARSLESVQGNISGQTQAIQSMTMSSQQQATSMKMLVDQLGLKIGDLTRAVSQMSTSMNMSSMTGQAMAGTAQAQPPMMGPPPPPMYSEPGGSMPIGSRVGGAIMTGGRMAMGGIMSGGAMAARGMYRAGGAIGAATESLTSPIFGTPTYGPGQGQIGPQFGADTGIYRSAVMASGVGIHPRMLQRAGSEQIRQASSERFQQRFADAALGLMGGGGQLGLELGADAAGYGIASAAGASLFGSSMAGSMVAGGLMAAPVTLAGGAAIGETMRQSGNIRGYGEQFGRGAHRYMGPGATSGFGSLRKPGMAQRQRFGREANRMAIQDLTFDAEDTREMFAGIQQQDLMRGVSSTDEVVRRFRETKETFKLIGRRLGQGLQEAAGTAATLQDLGFDPTGQRGRAAIFGAGSISGLTPGEGVQKSAQFGQQFAGQGVGREMMGIGAQGMQMSQSAIQRGIMSNVDIAALGGREASGQAMGQMAGNFMQSAMGRSMLMAGGMDAKGLGLQEMMGRAGARASQNINTLIDIELGGEEQMRDFLSDPGAMNEIIKRVQDQSRVFRMGNPDISSKNAMRLALRQFMPNASGAQLTAVVKQIEGRPEAIKQQMRQQMHSLSDEISTTTAENTAIFARAGRKMKQIISPAAEGLVGGVNEASAGMAAGLTNIQRAVTGTEMVNLGRGLDMDTLNELTSRTAGREAPADEKEMIVPSFGNPDMIEAVETKNAEIRKRNKTRGEQRLIGSKDVKVNDRLKARASRMVKSAVADNQSKIGEIKQILDNPNSTPDQKRAAMKDMLDVLSQNTYDVHKGKGGLKMKKAFQEAVERETGYSAHGIMMGRELEATSFGAADEEKRDDAREGIREILTLDDDADAANYATPEVMAYLDAKQNNEDVDIAGQRLIDNEMGGIKTQIDEMIDKDYESNVWGSGDWITDADDRITQLKDLIGKKGEGGLLDLERKGAGAARAQALTRGMAKAMGSVEGMEKYAGVRGKMGSKDTRKNMLALEELRQNLSEKEADKLAAGEETGRFGRVMQVLRNIELDDGLDAGEKDAITKLLPKMDKAQADQLFKDVLDPAGVGLGNVAFLANDVKTQGNLQVLAKHGVLTGGQAAQVLNFAAKTTELAAQVKDITDIVAEMKAKGG